jgi:tRNA nucleotidyltransferase (CCA-adding enzyme)
MNFPIPDELARILSETPELANAFLVGGCVRDALLEIPHKDLDIEVFGLGFEQLAGALARWGRTDLVGRCFGVVKLSTSSGHAYDFTIPRRDSKIAPGHKGFAAEFDASIGPREASSRRDFTINSLLYDPRRDEVLDFFGGRDDLSKKILRHTSDAFAEDPLRVLRGMQFAARFELTASPETLDLCQKMKGHFSELALERVREEWFKWAEKSVLPSAGLKFLVATSWVEHFPEIRGLIGTPQDSEWHPEGDVFTHTCHCLDALVKLQSWQQADAESRIVYSLAVLAHDFGKVGTTHEAERKGRLRIVSPGHDEASGPLAEKFLDRIGTPASVRDRVIPLVLHHMAHYEQMTDRGVRRLARRLFPENIEGLCLVMAADQLGRPPLPPPVSGTVDRLRQKAHELEVQHAAPKPILLGRHLIEAGMSPGEKFGEILRDAYEAQLEGEISDLPAALAWLERRREALRAD